MDRRVTDASNKRLKTEIDNEVVVVVRGLRSGKSARASGGRPIYSSSQDLCDPSALFFPTRKSALTLHPLCQPGALQGDLVSFLCHLGLLGAYRLGALLLQWKRTR